MTLLPSLQDRNLWLIALNNCASVYVNADIITDDAHCAIYNINGSFHVTFRGSKSAEDWINDGDVEMVDTPWGKIHAGFWRSYNSIASMVDDRLAQSATLIQNIFVDGHSLGGIQAMLYFLRLKKAGLYPLSGCITFGAPRGGDSAWAVVYDSECKDMTVRLVDAMDIVPRNPPKILGYRDIGHEAFLTSGGQLQYDPGMWEMDRDDIDGVIDDLRNLRIDALADHHLTHYQARIRALPPEMSPPSLQAA